MMRSRRLREKTSIIVTAIVQKIIEDVIDKSEATDFTKDLINHNRITFKPG